MKKIHRFFAPVAVVGDRATIGDPAVAHQVARVLRLQDGEEIWACPGDGQALRVSLTSVRPEGLEGRIVERVVDVAEPSRDVALWCSLLKREHFEQVVEQATQIGVREIRPIIFRRTIKTGTNLERLGKIAREAAETAGRSRLPVIHAPVALAVALKARDASRGGWLFDLEATDPIRAATVVAGQGIDVLVGPEGGLEPEEIQAVLAAGWSAYGLSGLTFRAETAAAIAAYAAVSA
jgi:16S rRNA (uracil1498-N3)-methyltransferase